MDLIPEFNSKHKLVMLVDDSSIDNYVNKKIIERYGFSENVATYTRARPALRYLLKLKTANTEEIPDIIFLDLNMPEIDGYEFMETFNLLSDTIKKKIQIVVLTSSINPKDVEKCNQYPSILTFLHKPLVKNNLDTLNDLLQGNQNSLKVAIGA